jgi:mRNA interferase MazF
MMASGPEAGRTLVRRGEIWWVTFDPTQGGEIRKTRPAVVVTADALNHARRTVVVVPLSNGPQPHPPIVVATPSGGANSVAVCDQLRAVDRRRLTRTQGRLSEVDLRSVEDGLRRILEL